MPMITSLPQKILLQSGIKVIKVRIHPYGKPPTQVPTAAGCTMPTYIDWPKVGISKEN